MTNGFVEGGKAMDGGGGGEEEEGGAAEDGHGGFDLI